LINSLVREYMEKELGKEDPHASKKGDKKEQF
jgi:hypothetical protein